MVAETALTPNDLIAPLFVREGITEPHPISSLPGVVQHTLASAKAEVKELIDLGVPAVILFGVPEHKDAEGTGASDPDGIVQIALKELRDAHGDDVVLIADLCLDDPGLDVERRVRKRGRSRDEITMNMQRHA